MKKWFFLFFICLFMIMSHITAGADVIHGGTWDNLSWKLSSDGTLTISGNGEMQSFVEDNVYHGDKAWHLYKADIRKVIFEGNITTISDFAFSVCENLAEISIPDSVTRINRYAFTQCSSLQEVFIPNSVICIEANAFAYCYSLSAIHFSNNLESIGMNAFRECTSFTSIDIPGSVSTIGNHSFSHCSNLISVSLHEGTTVLEASAFAYCTNLESIVLPDSVETLAGYTFSGCSALKSITLSAKLTSMGNHIFGYSSNLEKIGVPICCSYAIQWCNDNNFSDILIVYPHVSIVIDEKIQPTSTKAGLTEGSHCSCCGEVLIPQTVVHPLVWGLEANDGGVSITGYYGNEINVTIPETLDGLPVTGIENDAFGPEIERVRVPISVTYISPSAFAGTPVVYCKEYSEADYWSIEQGNETVYIDDIVNGSFYIISMDDALRLEYGTEASLNAHIFPNLQDSIVWTSSDNNVASVHTGTVTGNAPGSAIITLRAGSVSASALVEVYGPASDFRVNPSESYVITKETLQLTVADLLPLGADDTFTWSSDNTRCATVDQNGLVSCLRPGEATITATSSRGLTRSCTIHVCYPVTSVSFSRENLTAFADIPFQIIANVRMQTQTCVNRLVTFESSDPAIADVDQDGVVMPYANGSITITATAESGVFASCTVNVISMDNAPTLALPGGVTHIEDEAFLGTSAVIYVIPFGTESIGSLAFADLPNAQLIRIPGSVTSIADDAFSGSSVVIQCPAGSYAETWTQDHGITVQN